MTSLLALLVCCCCFLSALADDPEVEALEKAIADTNKDIKTTKVQYESLSKELNKQKETCMVAVGVLQAIENRTEKVLQKDVETLKALGSNLTKADAEYQEALRLLRNETKNVDKFALELVLMQGDVKLLAERRQANQSEKCFKLMDDIKHPLLLGMSNSNDPRIPALKAELKQAKAYLHQLQNRIAEGKSELIASKDLCEKKIKDWKAELKEKAGAVSESERDIKKLTLRLRIVLSLTNQTQNQFKLLVVRKDYLKRLLDRKLTALRKYKRDNECYKALQRDVVGPL